MTPAVAHALGYLLTLLGCTLYAAWTHDPLAVSGVLGAWAATAAIGVIATRKYVRDRKAAR
jgi:hypothetical protein